MAYEFKITKNGVDTSSTDPKDFSINSNYNMLKIGIETNGVIALPQNSTAFTDIEHNLGYNPTIYIFIKHPQTGKWYQAPVYINHVSVISYHLILADWSLTCEMEYRDTDTLRIRIFGSGMSSSEVVAYKAYILVDPRFNAWFSKAGSPITRDQPVNDFALRIGRDGVDALTCKDEDLVFSSDFKTFKIKRCVTFGANIDRQIEPVQHGLGYPPFFFAYTAGGGLSGFGWRTAKGRDGVPLAWVDNEYIYYSGRAAGSITYAIDSLE